MKKTPSSLFLLLLALSLVIGISIPQQGNGNQIHKSPIATAGSVQPIGQSGTWEFLFDDEFNGTSIDTTKWSFTSSAESNCDANGCSNPGNQQLEYNQGKNCTVSQGILTITAKRESAGGRSWTSCMLHSKPQFKTMFLETRAKFPAKKGFWPGFWIWNGPQDEVDIFEYYSDNKTRLYLTDHTGGGAECTYTFPFDPTGDFHTYAAYMDGTNITWYIDGQRVCNGPGSPKQQASILLDMFVYSQIPPDPATTSETMQVDYIRAWKKVSTTNPSTNTQPIGVTPTLYCLSGQPCTPSATLTTPLSNPNTTSPRGGGQNANGRLIPTTTAQPCQASETVSIQHDKSKKKKHKKKHRHNRGGGFLEIFFQFIFKLIEALLGKLGVSIPDLNQPTPCEQTSPSTTPTQPIEPSNTATPTLFQTTAAPTQAQPQENPSSTASTKRNIPIAPHGGLGNFNLSSKNYIMAFRFVLDKPTTIDRWYFAINAEGTSCVGGRKGYGSGNGGIEFGRIVEVDQATGLPINTILAQESVNGCTAHNRTISEFGVTKTHQAHFIQFSPISLQAGKMYAFLLSNTDPNPGTGGSASSGNHVSPNLNFANINDMGPQGKNTLDANAPGAMYGYDPRETTMWSDDGGASWKFGDQVGWYQKGSGSGRMWIVGYRSGGKNMPHGFTYMTWPSPKSGTSITYKNVPKAVTLTQAGGANDASVGVVTVTNTTTGLSASTPSLGSGVPVGTLSKPVPVAAGQSYTIKASGSVDIGDASPWDKIFGLGSNYSCSGCSKSSDMPGLFALPHPYY